MALPQCGVFGQMKVIQMCRRGARPLRAGIRAVPKAIVQSNQDIGVRVAAIGDAVPCEPEWIVPLRRGGDDPQAVVGGPANLPAKSLANDFERVVLSARFSNVRVALRMVAAMRGKTPWAMETGALSRAAVEPPLVAKMPAHQQ